MTTAQRRRRRVLNRMFFRAYAELSRCARCDAVGSVEYCRLRREFLAGAFADNVREWIVTEANRPARG